MKGIRIIPFLFFVSLAQASVDTLNIKRGARGAVFGDSFVSVADETSAIYYNPAGLGFIYSPELQIMHNLHISENSLTSLGYLSPTGFGTIALAADYFTGPQIDSFEDGMKKNSFNYYTAAGTLGYALKLSPAVCFGISSRYFLDTIGESSINGFAADAGLLLRTINEIFSAGIAVSNLASSDFDKEPPRTYTAGFSFKWSLPAQYSDIILAVGYNHTDGKKPSYSVAVEHIGVRTLGLRVGYKFLSDDYQKTAQDALSQFIAGLSLRIGMIQFNYSYQPLASLGESHRMDFQWRFLGWSLRKKKLPAKMKVESSLFSPNSDGLKDVSFFIPEIQGLKEIDSWELKIKNQAGIVIKTYSDKEKFPNIITWDGKDNKNTIVPEGIYKASFIAQDRTKIAMTPEYDLKVDTTPPMLSLSISTNVFTIDPENLSNTLTFYTAMSDTSGIDFWQITVQNERGKIVKTFRSTSTAREINWDGRDDYYASYVPDGKYQAKLTVVDNAGNRASAESSFSIKILPKVEVVVKEVIKEVHIKEESRGLVVTLASHVLFDPGKSELKSKAKSVLEEVINILNSYPENKVLIEGHTDATGDREKNKILSSRRAWGVYSFLVKNGIDPSRLSVKGWGQEKPIASNSTEAGRAQNRRVEIIILKK